MCSTMQIVSPSNSLHQPRVILVALRQVFPGNRPSSSILLPRLNAFTTGQLLALYEHRTVVQVTSVACVYALPATM